MTKVSLCFFSKDVCQGLLWYETCRHIELVSRKVSVRVSVAYFYNLVRTQWALKYFVKRFMQINRLLYGAGQRIASPSVKLYQRLLLDHPLMCTFCRHRIQFNSSSCHSNRFLFFLFSFKFFSQALFIDWFEKYGWKRIEVKPFLWMSKNNR